MAKRVTAGLSIALLVGIAGYCIDLGITAAADTPSGAGTRYAPWMFWTAIGMFWVIAAASLWGAHRIYRRRFVKVS